MSYTGISEVIDLIESRDKYPTVDALKMAVGKLKQEQEIMINFEAENKLLREALKKYGKHTYDCIMNWDKRIIIVRPSKEICTCGFEQALKEKL